MNVLDLFCKAGGAAMGYHLAGFDVIGVDIDHQKNYPFEFIQADALGYLSKYHHKYDVIHASPPCQRFSGLTPPQYRNKHPDLIKPLREILLSIGKTYVIENVPGARHELESPIKLCGTMFGLKVFRHRYFEISPQVILLTPQCKHDFYPIVVSGTTKRIKPGHKKRREHTAQECRDAMDIQWMIKKELDEAIPPAYTKFIGRAIMEYEANHIKAQDEL